MRLKLAKSMTSNVVKSPWGDASIAAQRIVNTKRDEKKVEAKTKHKSAGNGRRLAGRVPH